VDKQAFKQLVAGMKRKFDEENFEEAEAQAYRAWTTTTVPSDISPLLSLPEVMAATASSPPFVRLLAGLKAFTEREPYVLPLTATLPDMKADTANYIKLQNLYKRHAEEERAVFKSLVPGYVDDDLVTTFVKNAHALRLLKGKKLGEFDMNQDAICEFFGFAI
jgi:NEDD8-activating enzyme E1 regulatory subunit